MGVVLAAIPGNLARGAVLIHFFGCCGSPSTWTSGLSALPGWFRGPASRGKSLSGLRKDLGVSFCTVSSCSIPGGDSIFKNIVFQTATNASELFLSLTSTADPFFCWGNLCKTGMERGGPDRWGFWHLSLCYKNTANGP